MRRRFPPNDGRSEGSYPSEEPGQSDRWRWPDGGARALSRGDATPSGTPGQYPPPSRSGAMPRYGPGGPPRQPVSPARTSASTPSPRTDPALYEWDRLTMEQQRAVLATIGARSPASRFPRRLVLVALVLVLVVVVLVVLFVLARGS